MKKKSRGSIQKKCIFGEKSFIRTGADEHHLFTTNQQPRRERRGIKPSARINSVAIYAFFAILLQIETGK